MKIKNKIVEKTDERLARLLQNQENGILDSKHSRPASSTKQHQHQVNNTYTIVIECLLFN